MGEQGETPPVPKPAATVMLIRDVEGDEGIEVFLVQRHGKIGFMGGKHVFPGGKVCDDDRSADLRARVEDMDALAAHDVWGEGFDGDDALALALAAVRETFEEAGVLLGSAVPDRATLERARGRLLGGEPFSALLGELGARLSLSLLTPFSRWITPDSEPARFDTAFYVARAPLGQRAEHDQREVVGGDWFTPGVALEALERGEIRLAPPTSRTLQDLAETASVDAAVALAGSRRPPLIAPLIREIGDELVLIYPGDPDHPMREQTLAGPTRRVLRKL